jgi:glycosyltransferase involved in cell wall biosynthesis
MKIGIEGQRLFRPKKHGMDMVALELIRNLQELDHQNEYFIFVKEDEDVSLRETGNFRIITLKPAPYPVWEQFILPDAAIRYRCDLLHCTSNTAPVFADIPLVVTIHDIIYMEKLSLFRKGFTPYQKFGNLYRRMIVPQVVKKAAKIITVSEFEKKRIADFFHLDDTKLRAIYNGVGTHFKKVTDAAILHEIRIKYNLPEQFFFFFGNTDPKKNTAGVLRALSLFYKETSRDIPLVMLDFDRSELNRLINEVGDPSLRDHIHLTGYIPNRELPVLYSLCTVFLYPSLRESFGIPMLEAMSCGTPVITSNTSSMPEVGGNAALFIDPYKAEQITEAIRRILTESELRNQLIHNGFINAARFSWNKMAADVLALYQELIHDLKKT